ncbi:MAG: hypothetical protein ACOY94_02315 [Bacillota bacterium]
MSGLAGLEALVVAVRALLEHDGQEFWAPAPPPEPLDPALAGLLAQLEPGSWQRDLGLALALRRNGPLRQAYLRAALARGGLPDLLERLALAEGEGWPALRLRLLAGAWRNDPVRLESLAEGLAERVGLGLAAGLAYLDPAVRLPAEAWEVPRLSQPPEVGAGVVFPAAVIAEALLTAGSLSVAPLVKEIVDRWTPVGWSYWNPAFLPPDADTLGQVLQVLVRTLDPGDFGRFAAGPAALAAAQVGPDGAVPVMLAAGGAWSREAADGVWVVRRCPAVAANLFTGLYLLDPERYGETAERGARLLLSWRERTGSWEGPGYRPPYGRYVALRFLALLGSFEGLADERELILAEQRWDGSWGTPQATALNLSTLLTLGERGDAVDRAALYLTETQQVQGCWRSEPLWLTPGPGGYPATYYESVPVTTALCLRALARWMAHRRT